MKIEWKRKDKKELKARTEFNLHGGQDQENGKVDLNDHVYVILSKEPCCEADGQEKDGWDKHGEQVTDDWPA